MHFRPCTEASKAVEVLQRDCNGLQVVLENERTGIMVEGSGMIKYILELQPRIGDQIRISLFGDFPEVQLRTGSASIGEAFSSFVEIPVIDTYD
jgi:hypothetical protein